MHFWKTYKLLSKLPQAQMDSSWYRFSAPNAHFSLFHRLFLLTPALQDGIFLSEMFGHFHLPQTNCSSRSKQATFTSSSEQRIGALEEKTVSLRHGEAFFSSFFFFSPSWHQNGLVGRKRESGGKTNDEKVYSIPAPSLNTWKERERHIWIQSASLWWHQVFFSQIRRLEATGCLWQLGAQSRLLPSEHMTPPLPPPPPPPHITSTIQLPPFLLPFTPTTSPTWEVAQFQFESTLLAFWETFCFFCV